MKNIVNKLMNFIGLSDNEESIFHSFIVGNTCFLVFELSSNQKFFKSNYIFRLLKCNVDCYWFRNYKEFETYIDIVEEKNSDYLLIMIG